MEDFLAKVLPRPGDTVGHSEAVNLKYFLCPQNFVVLRKICFIIKMFPPKNVFGSPKP